MATKKATLTNRSFLPREPPLTELPGGFYNALDKLVDCDFVCGVERGRIEPAYRRAFRSEFETFEGVEIGLFEVERKPVERQRRKTYAPPFGIEQSERYRQLHVGIAHLRDHAAVGKAHHRMHDALPVHDDLYLVRRHAEKMHRLDDLKALVHHARAVDGHLDAHVPSRMLDRVGKGRAGDLFRLFAAERSARSGQDQRFAFRRVLGASVQTLPDRAVFAVDGQDARAAFFAEAVYGIAARDQSLLVCESDAAARLYRRDRRQKAADPDQRVEQKVDLARRKQPRRVTAAKHLGAVRVEPPRRLFVFDSDDLGLELGDLPLKQFDVAAAAQPVHLEFARIGADDVERLSAYRAGRTEYRQRLHDRFTPIPR